MTATVAAERSRTGLPRSAWLIVAIEFWERFSFYGMLGILALFLAAAPANGGFGWQDADTLSLIGLYTGLMYGLPMLGGIAADRVISPRRAIAIGASLLAIGHFMMASPVFLPWLVGLSEGRDLVAALDALGVPLGMLVPPPESRAAVAGDPALALAYRLQAIGFYVALACLVIGNGTMKASMAVMVGDLFEPGDHRRERAFGYFYLSISVGGFLSGLIVGWIATRFGWHWGFTIAGIGMLFALVPYLVLGPAWLGNRGLRPRGKTVIDAPAAPGTVMPRIGLLALLALFVCLFEIGWFQFYGSWALLMEREVDRVLYGFTIPTPWLLALNSLVVIVATPLLIGWWDKRAAVGRAIDPIIRYAAALAMAALASLIMAGITQTLDGLLIAVVIAIALLSIGEVFVWVANYGLVYRVAPPTMTTLAMGAWFATTLGVGGWLAGRLAATLPGRPELFLLIVAIALALAAATAFFARGALRHRAASLGVDLLERQQ